MVNSKVRWLWRYLALIVVVGSLAVVVAEQLSPAAALAENPQAELPPLKIEDDFEEYTVTLWPNTTFPDPPWKLSGLEGYVYNESLLPGGVADNQLLQLVGLQDGCGGSVAHHPINGGGEIIIEGRIRNSSPEPRSLTGCHKKYGGIELSAGPHWVYPHRGLIAFSDAIRNQNTGARTIRGGAFEVDEGPGVYLQDFNLDQWYHVEIHYKHTGANVELSFWIDNVPWAENPLTLPAKPHEPYLRYIGLWSGEDFAWHDDVRVWAAAGTDPGPYEWPYSVYLPLVRR
jgi:hypothetical protein